MRLTAVQLKLYPQQRARNLAMVTEIVKRAADRDQAPEVIVLGGICDNATLPRDGQRITRAMCQGFAQSIATLAREWGLWIACGHLMEVGDDVSPVMSLFDPDGDTYLRYPHGVVVQAKDSGETEPAKPPFACETPFGGLVLASDSVFDESASIWKSLQPCLIIAPTASSSSAVSPATWMDRARYGGVGLCVASAFIDGSVKAPGWTTAILGPEGAVLAEQPPGREGLISAELDIQRRRDFGVD